MSRVAVHEEATPPPEPTAQPEPTPEPWESASEYGIPADWSNDGDQWLIPDEVFETAQALMKGTVFEVKGTTYKVWGKSGHGLPGDKIPVPVNYAFMGAAGLLTASDMMMPAYQAYLEAEKTAVPIESAMPEGWSYLDGHWIVPDDFFDACQGIGLGVKTLDNGMVVDIQAHSSVAGNWVPLPVNTDFMGADKPNALDIMLKAKKAWWDAKNQPPKPPATTHWGPHVKAEGAGSFAIDTMFMDDFILSNPSLNWKYEGTSYNVHTYLGSLAYPLLSTVSIFDPDLSAYAKFVSHAINDHSKKHFVFDEGTGKWVKKASAKHLLMAHVKQAIFTASEQKVAAGQSFVLNKTVWTVVGSNGKITAVKPADNSQWTNTPTSIEGKCETAFDTWGSILNPDPKLTAEVEAIEDGPVQWSQDNPEPFTDNALHEAYQYAIDNNVPALSTGGAALFKVNGHQWWHSPDEGPVPNYKNEWKDVPSWSHFEKSWAEYTKTHPLATNILSANDTMKIENLHAMFAATAKAKADGDLASTNTFKFMGHEVYATYQDNNSHGKSFPIWNKHESYPSDTEWNSAGKIIWPIYQAWKDEQDLAPKGKPWLSEANLFKMFEAAQGKTSNFTFMGQQVYPGYHWSGFEYPVFNNTESYDNVTAYEGAHAILPVWQKWKALPQGAKPKKIKPSLSNEYLFPIFEAFASTTQEGTKFNDVPWYKTPINGMVVPVPGTYKAFAEWDEYKSAHAMNQVVADKFKAWKGAPKFALKDVTITPWGNVGTTNGTTNTMAYAPPPFPGPSDKMPKWGPATAGFEKKLEEALKLRLGPYATDSMVKAVKEDMLPVLHGYWEEVNMALVALKMTAAEQDKDVPKSMPGWTPSETQKIVPQSALPTKPEPAENATKVESSTAIWKAALSPYLKKKYQAQIDFGVACAALPHGTGLDTHLIDMWIVILKKHTKKGNPPMKEDYYAATAEWEKALGTVSA